MQLIENMIYTKYLFNALKVSIVLLGIFLIIKSLITPLEVGTKSLYLLLVVFKGIVFLMGFFLTGIGIASLLFAQHWSGFVERKKEVIKNLFTLLIACVVIFFMMEGFLRIIDFLEPRSVETYRTTDDVMHHAFLPNSSGVFTTPEWNVSYKINSLGLRDYEYELYEFDNQEKQRTRILMLGDSFIEGYGVELEQSVSKVLEKKLNKNQLSKDKKYEVINAGVSSYSPILEYLYLKEKGLKLKPDIIILNLDLLDVSNDVEYKSKALFNEQKKIIAVPGSKHEQAAVEKGVIGTLFSLKIIQKTKNLYDHLLFYKFPFLFNKRFNNAIKTKNILIDPYVISRTDNIIEFKEEIDITKQYIQEVAALSKSNNITFILHIFPRPHQVSATEWKSRTLNGFDLGEIYSTKVLEEFEVFARENNILAINSMDYFKNTTEHGVFFTYDYHWTEKGHEIAAQALYEYLYKITSVSLKHVPK
ncbi:hypothetical protein HYY69_05260 [Candidatus Woesearchaeota archaeon]|nr:hypothetical protein [Candidatus Woesearchaeota archaeon]